MAGPSRGRPPAILLAHTRRVGCSVIHVSSQSLSGALVDLSGHLVADPDEAPVGEAKPEKLRKFNDEPAPWHFKVLVGGVSVYLAYRLVQGIGWVAHHV